MRQRKIDPIKALSLVLPAFTPYFFAFLLLSSLALFFWVISPFFYVLIFAALIAVVFMPLNRMFLRFFKKFPSLAAFSTTLIVFLLVLIPMLLFGFFLAQEAVDAYQLIQNHLYSMDLEALRIDRLADWPWVGEWLSRRPELYLLEQFLNSLEISFFTILEEAGQNISAFVVNQTGSFVWGLSNWMIDGFILLLTVFFFLRDGDHMLAFLKNISPLPQAHEDEIQKKLRETTYAVVIGNFGTALLQGSVGAIGFAIAGVENFLFWSTLMVFASLIPYFGSALIWGPLGLLMFIFGENPFWGIFILLWGVFVVASIDNFVRPYLITSNSHMHPLATFLVVFGGILVFGMKGIVIGPLILSLTLTVLHIYQLEYQNVLKGPSV